MYKIGDRVWFVYKNNEYNGHYIPYDGMVVKIIPYNGGDYIKYEVEYWIDQGTWNTEESQDEVFRTKKKCINFILNDIANKQILLKENIKFLKDELLPEKNKPMSRGVRDLWKNWRNSVLRKYKEE